MRFIYALVFRVYYFNWSKFYQFLQRKFTSQYANKVKVVQGNIKMAKVLAKDPAAQYAKLWEIYHKVNWKKDTWYMLWDVISDPYLMLYRGGDDCDNFAYLGYKIFGDTMTFLTEGRMYTFRSFYFLMFHPVPLGGGHVIAVWEDSSGELQVISNKQLLFFKNESEMLTWAEKSWEKVSFIVEGSQNLKYLRTRKV